VRSLLSLLVLVVLLAAPLSAQPARPVVTPAPRPAAELSVVDAVLLGLVEASRSFCRFRRRAT